MNSFIQKAASLFKAALSIFKEGDPFFSEFEQYLLKELSLVLPEDYRRPFDLRISQVNLVQRCPYFKDVNCYTIHKSKVYFDPAWQMPVPDQEEFILAKAAIRLKSKNKISVNFFVVNGRYFSMGFSKSIKGLKVEDIAAVHFQLNIQDLGTTPEDG